MSMRVLGKRRLGGGIMKQFDSGRELREGYIALLEARGRG